MNQQHNLDPDHVFRLILVETANLMIVQDRERINTSKRRNNQNEQGGNEQGARQ